MSNEWTLKLSPNCHTFKVYNVQWGTGALVFLLLADGRSVAVDENDR